jgi:hypothetical protein
MDWTLQNCEPLPFLVVSWLCQVSSSDAKLTSCSSQGSLNIFLNVYCFSLLCCFFRSLTFGFFFFFGSTGLWTQGLHLEPLHLVIFIFFLVRVWWTIWLGWLPSAILLISASWVAGITGVSRWCLFDLLFFLLSFLSFCHWSPEDLTVWILMIPVGFGVTDIFWSMESV